MQRITDLARAVFWLALSIPLALLCYGDVERDAWLDTVEGEAWARRRAARRPRALARRALSWLRRRAGR